MEISNFGQAVNAYNQATKMGGEADGLATETDEAASNTPRFADLLSEGLSDARKTGYQGEITATEALSNKTELHELVTAVSNAELTLNTVIAVRDRIISAYQDIIKMPV